MALPSPQPSAMLLRGSASPPALPSIAVTATLEATRWQERITSAVGSSASSASKTGECPRSSTPTQATAFAAAVAAATAACAAVAQAVWRPTFSTQRRRSMTLGQHRNQRSPAVVMRVSAESDRGAEAKPGSTSHEQDNPLQAFVAFVAGILGSLFSFIPDLGGASAKQSSSTTRLIQQLGASPVDTVTDRPVYSLGAFPQCTSSSNFRLPGRHFTVITTAALPWKTGPAVNALLRALHLAKRGFSVVLIMPWIERGDQEKLFWEGTYFDSREAQVEYIKRWCREGCQIDPDALDVQFQWYEARYVEAVRSIFPNGDLSRELDPDVRRDILILEEPEHLCWYHEGKRWPELFQHVVGVVHTNYQAYIAGMGYTGLMGDPVFRDSTFFTFTSLVCSAYCDVTIKLSGAGIRLPNEVTCNIHGVREEFLEIGRQAARAASDSADGAPEAKAYFMGKAVFKKGWDELLSLFEALKARGSRIHMDGFGTGPDAEAIRDRADALIQRGCATLNFEPGLDHADPRVREYKVLVNPSVSEILCTVTAEAIAMGKRVVLPRHKSNDFFAERFPENCHFYTHGDPASFLTAFKAAMEAPWPNKLPSEEDLSWDAAIDRLCDAAQVRVLSGPFSRPSEVASAQLAYELHRGFQTDTPVLSSFLKEATLKSKTATPWEQYMVEWQKNDQTFIKSIDARMRKFQMDTKRQQQKLEELLKIRE